MQMCMFVFLLCGGSTPKHICSNLQSRIDVQAVNATVDLFQTMGAIFNAMHLRVAMSFARCMLRMVMQPRENDTLAKWRHFGSQKEMRCEINSFI